MELSHTLESSEVLHLCDLMAQHSVLISIGGREPSNITSEMCGSVRLCLKECGKALIQINVAVGNGKWGDISCSRNYPYVCEQPATGKQ